MTTPKKIKKAAKYSDAWLANKQAQHVKMVENSIIKFQNHVIDQLAKLAVNKTGRIEGILVNLKQAQEIQKQIEVLFDQDFSENIKKVIADFDSVKKAIQTSFGYIDESVKFTSVDKTMMEVLKNGYYQQYFLAGSMQKSKVIQAMYDQVLANAKFSELMTQIEGLLTGEKSVAGVPLSNYAKTYANDFIMNFHNEVNLTKAQKAGLTHFLYVGNIIKDSRSFCIARAGRYYTAEEINSWIFKWAGKSGPAMTHRGGWNCRHHWQPIKPKWIGNVSKIEIQDWFAE